MASPSGRLVVCLTLWLLLSGQSTYKWDAYSSLLLPGTTAPERVSPDGTEVLFYATQFANAAPERYLMSDIGSETEILLYEKESYRAELIYVKRNARLKVLFEIMADIDTMFGFFDDKPITVIDKSYTPSPGGKVVYQRFSTPDAICFDFYFDWQDSERKFGAFFQVTEPSSLQGYVCNSNPSGFSHDDVNDLLSRLGVVGIEPGSGLNLNGDDPSAESPSDSPSTLTPSSDR